MGKILYWIGLLGFGAAIVLDLVCNPIIAREILKQDAAVTGEIRPNGKAMLIWLLPMLFLVLMVFGIAIVDGAYHILLIVVFGAGGMGVLVGTEMRTYLQLDGQTLVIRKPGTVREYRLSQVRAVSWKPCRGIIGKFLFLVMEDGTSYWFNMDFYVGVQNMYYILSAETEGKT